MGMEAYQNRRSPKTGPDDYPTPPWGTRAFLHHVLSQNLTDKTCWEPAANRGHMVIPLQERFDKVFGTDIVDHGAGFGIYDFLSDIPPYLDPPVDWIITNPPFNKAEEFAIRALSLAKEGVALLLRSAWAEGKGRYERLFSHTPPTIIAQYTERLPIVAGRLDRKAVSAMPYAWFVWTQIKTAQQNTRFMWIPPCRKEMEREEDYP